MESLSIPTRRSRPALLGSRRLLALAGDERLVEQIRRGNEAAFEVAFERYGGPILGFCRHLLGSREEAEDAVQHTFAAAHRQLLRDERPIDLKPWLYTIARHRCLSLLRARRAEPAPLEELAGEGLSEQVERRAELRELLADVAELPLGQRAALLLAELGDLSHAQIATVLECEEARVKALVYRARSGLIARREARELPCEQIREQLATLRGGALRRLDLKHHLHSCPGCRAYRDEVKRQRRLLGAALPVVPSLGLKASVLSAVGGGGGAAGGGGALIGGVQAALSSLGGAGAAKTAVAVVAATGAVLGGGVAVERIVDSDRPPAAVAPSSQRPAPSGGALEGRNGGGGGLRQATATPTRDRARPPAAANAPEGATKAHTRTGSDTAAVARTHANGRALGRDEQPSQPGQGVANRPLAPPGQTKPKPPARSGGGQAPAAAPPVERGPQQTSHTPGQPRQVQRGPSSQALERAAPTGPTGTGGRSDSAPGKSGESPPQQP